MLQFCNLYRKRRAQRTSPASVCVAVIDLDDGDDDAAKQGFVFSDLNSRKFRVVNMYNY